MLLGMNESFIVTLWSMVRPRPGLRGSILSSSLGFSKLLGFSYITSLGGSFSFPRDLEGSGILSLLNEKTGEIYSFFFGSGSFTVKNNPLLLGASSFLVSLLSAGKIKLSSLRLRLKLEDDISILSLVAEGGRFINRGGGRMMSSSESFL
jgi:hypothetical protein